MKTNSWQEDVVFASGNGGQYIIVINRPQLVVVFTQGNYHNWRAKRAFEILGKYIIPHFENISPHYNIRRTSVNDETK